MNCPRCGSRNIRPVSVTKVKTKGFGGVKGCIGFLLFGWVGWLCGLCGMGKTKSKSHTEFVCIDCGQQFR